MRSLFLKSFLLLAGFILVSCNTSQRGSDAGSKIKSVTLQPWIGRPISELLSHPKYGIPDSKDSLGDDKIVTYRQIFAVDGYANNNTVSVNLFCRRSFVYKDDNIINEVLEEGNCHNTKDFLPKQKAQK